MPPSVRAALDNARLMRQFGDDLPKMPALLKRYRQNLDVIAVATKQAADRRRVSGAGP